VLVEDENLHLPALISCLYASIFSALAARHDRHLEAESLDGDAGVGIEELPVVQRAKNGMTVLRGVVAQRLVAFDDHRQRGADVAELLFELALVLFVLLVCAAPAIAIIISAVLKSPSSCAPSNRG
jgi:hypothetical protein